MTVVALQVGFFPDGESVRAALQVLEQTDRVIALDLTGRDAGEEAFWDRVIDAIAEADVVVTL